MTFVSNPRHSFYSNTHTHAKTHMSSFTTIVLWSISCFHSLFSLWSDDPEITNHNASFWLLLSVWNAEVDISVYCVDNFISVQHCFTIMFAISVHWFFAFQNLWCSVFIVIVSLLSFSSGISFSSVHVLVDSACVKISFRHWESVN